MERDFLRKQDLGDQIFALLEQRWRNAVGENRLADASSIAIAAHLIFQELKIPAFENIGRTWMAVIDKRVSSEKTEEGDTVCSFCSLNKPDNELIVGVTGKICLSCAENIGREIKQRRR
jgi:hypothetical protein